MWGSANLTVVYPEFRRGEVFRHKLLGCMHPKLLLVLYGGPNGSSMLRVIVSSANLSSMSWAQVGEVPTLQLVLFLLTLVVVIW